jgi:hypothetical protein
MDEMAKASQARFESYVGSLVEVIGHSDRGEPLHDYCVGLLMPGERKSVEPIAAVVAPARVSAKHQSLLHLVSQAPWSDETVLQKVRELVVPSIERQGGPIEAWIVDDTGFTKKGTHSVGVARQYCGRLGNPSINSGGQLPGRGDALNCQSCGEPAHRLPSLSAERMDQSRRTPQAGACPKGGEVQDQTADLARSDPCGACGGHRTRHCAG